MSPTRTSLWLSVVAAAIGSAAASGCSTEAFCFYNCGDATATATSTASGTGGTGGNILNGGGGDGGCVFDCQGGGGQSSCIPTVDPKEICDGVDNDCDGKTDNLDPDDFKDPKTCGTCDTDCYKKVANCAIDGVTCTPSGDPGNLPGTCSCTQCADDYYTIDAADPCGYYCVASGLDESTCNNSDDDCDGQKDEDVDFCSSPVDCGYCGHNCSLAHATASCLHTDQVMPCSAQNTACVIDDCECTGAGNCWWNADNLDKTGCEYQCDLTNGGVEICTDGLDNDCDGLLDSADNLAGDPLIGQPCFGDPDGLCATLPHQGITICLGSQVTCDGAAVLHENQTPELCNGIDDDCDGVVDDSPVDVGMPCGLSNIFPCAFGTVQCVAGQKTCVGAVDPQPETCNGIDDDCDGAIDKTGMVPPSDSVGDCNVPTPPPPGYTSPCIKGSLACIGGVLDCVGDVGPTSPTDLCGQDANCNGIAENQPNLLTDVHHCGSCSNDCYTGAVHSIWACVAGACQFQGCEPGYFDPPPTIDQKCEYQCTFVSAQELCNGNDDNCNGQVDEGVIAPLPVQVCGVSPSATAPECTSGVTVACTAGAWKCTFPAGVCNPTCALATEICDTLDNDCDGLKNENVANFGKPCASDDGLPFPGHGACKTTGSFVCTGPNTTACSAVKADCASLPGGCTELCDGIDNDCDGLVDETYASKGTNAANFVKPTATQLGASLWIYSYEASRPGATNVTPGTGNGYWTSAPAGETLDKTPSCSVPGKVPWFNVSATEADQTCKAMAPANKGHVCTLADWQTACQATVPCTWGYNPRTGGACTTALTATKYCNIGPYDFDPAAGGDQDGLLPTASAKLQNCYADWSGLQGNMAATNKIYDITGNLREITFDTPNAVYKLMGGAFDTPVEAGATCNFTFYTVDTAFKLYDTGFRCCFTQDPGI